MTSRQRFLAACQCNPLDRPPLWIMRQAGRYLPEYRKLKETHGFLGLVKTPELAAEVTLQPLRRFALDAAIVFSDILIVPESLGQGYSFRDQGGIQMDFSVRSRREVDRLAPEGVGERLRYLFDALRLLRHELGDERALLGFAGAPWTLATYMVEGGSSSEFSFIKKLFHEDRELFGKLMDKVTAGVIACLQGQIDAGADAVQIFDSWAGAVPGSDYEEASLQYIRRIIGSLPSGFPVILFSRGAAQLDLLAFSGARVLGFDWTVNIGQAADRLPANVAVQGNLDPIILETTPEVVRRETLRLLSEIRHRPGHIFNLGHGIRPTAKIENVEALVETVVKSHS